MANATETKTTKTTNKRASAQKAQETRKFNQFRTMFETSIGEHQEALQNVAQAEIVSDDDLTMAERRAKRELHHMKAERSLLELDRDAAIRAFDFFDGLAKKASGNDKKKIGALADSLKSNSQVGKRNNALHCLLVGLSYFSDKEKKTIRYGEMAQFGSAVGSSLKTSVALFEALGLVERIKEDGKFYAFAPKWDNENLTELVKLYD